MCLYRVHVYVSMVLMSLVSMWCAELFHDKQGGEHQTMGESETHGKCGLNFETNGRSWQWFHVKPNERQCSFYSPEWTECLPVIIQPHRERFHMLSLACCAVTHSLFRLQWQAITMKWMDVYQLNHVSVIVLYNNWNCTIFFFMNIPWKYYLVSVRFQTTAL